jgi:hypothetical protein
MIVAVPVMLAGELTFREVEGDSLKHNVRVFTIYACVLTDDCPWCFSVTPSTVPRIIANTQTASIAQPMATLLRLRSPTALLLCGSET